MSSYDVSDASEQRTGWRRSSFCYSGECVEVAAGRGGAVLVRDSKDPRGSVLTYSAGEWRAFVQAIKAGELDDL